MGNRWSKIALGKILSERREEPNQDEIASGVVRIVGKISFSNGRIEFRSDYESKTRLISIRPGDIVLSGINAAKGAIAIYGTQELYPAAATIHYSSYEINEKKASREFLWWYFRSNPFRTVLAQALPGGIKTELKPKRFLPIEIPLPSLEEQRRIVSSIEYIAVKIGEANKLRNSPSRMVLGRMVGIGQEGPLLMTAALKDMASALKNELGELRNILVLPPRSGPSCRCAEDGIGLPVVMPSATTGFRYDPNQILPAESQNEFKDIEILQKGDILFPRGNKPDQVGNCGIYNGKPDKATYANLFMRLRVDPNKTLPEFLFYWLMTPLVRQHVLTHTKGTSPSIQKINSKGVLSIPVPINISLTTQTLWVERLRKFRNTTDELTRQIQGASSLLDALLPSILDKAFRGELNIAETERRPAKVVPIQRENTASEAFQEAVLIARLVRDFTSDEYLLSRKRYTKLAYLFHRKSKDDVKRRYLKKAAGPYSPWTKYQGPEKIALTNQYIQEGNKGKYNGFKPGPEIDQIDRYFATYWDEGNIAWLIERFKYKSTDNLEVLATVDMAMLDLVDQGRVVSLETVKDVIASEPEWFSKLSREVFSDTAIVEAIRELQGWFVYG